MSDRYVFTDNNRGTTARRVNHCMFLNVCSPSDTNWLQIAAEDCSEEYRDVGLDDDIAGDPRRRSDKRRGIYERELALERDDV